MQRYFDDVAIEQMERQCRDTWAREPKIREEFLTVEAFIAYSKAVAQGRVRILGNRAAA